MDLSQYKSITLGGYPMKKIELNGVEAWRRPYVNMVPTSIDLDGSIYNGCGYANDSRLSSSGSIKAQEGACCTGLIPATNGDIIRTYGGEWNFDYVFGQAFYTYIGFYDADRVWLGGINHYGGSSKGEFVVNNGYTNVEKCIIKEDENGVTTFESTVAVPYSYIRINLCGVGNDLVVTVNEEII